jgi:broad specificity phosphatase PhoE
VHAFHASDLVRARHTAEIVASAHAKPVVTHPGLRERWFGEHEGRPMPDPRERDAWVFEGEVEDLHQFRRRVRERLLEIARLHPDQTVFVVAHSGAMRNFLINEGLLELDSDDFKLSQRNGSYVVLSCDGRSFELERVGTVEAATDTHSE